MKTVLILLVITAVVLVAILISPWRRYIIELFFLLRIVNARIREGRARRVRLLCETDPEALLAACQELLRRVDAGDLPPGGYNFEPDPHPEIPGLPEVIAGLAPIRVYLEAGRAVIEMMGGCERFGVAACWPDDDRTHFPDVRYGNKELVRGLWYYDVGYLENPRLCAKRIDRLIERRKGKNKRDE